MVAAVVVFDGAVVVEVTPSAGVVGLVALDPAASLALLLDFAILSLVALIDNSFINVLSLLDFIEMSIASAV